MSIGGQSAFPTSIDSADGMTYRMWLIGVIATGLDGDVDYCFRIANAIIARLDAEERSRSEAQAELALIGRYISNPSETAIADLEDRRAEPRTEPVANEDETGRGGRMRDATDQMVSEISDTVDLMATRIRELETENAELQTEIADLERQLKEATP